MFIIGQKITHHSIFQNDVSLKSPGIFESENFLLAYSSFFLRTQRMLGKYLGVYVEYVKVEVVCGTQNLLRMRGKNLCIHGEDAKRHKSEDISVKKNNGPTLKFFHNLTFYIRWVRLSQKPFQATTVPVSIYMHLSYFKHLQKAYYRHSRHTYAYRITHVHL